MSPVRPRPEAPFCGRSSSGRARPCQGRGSEFEPRRPLQKSPPNRVVIFFACSSAVPSLRQPSGGHIRVRQTGHCLESGLLHPPQAALRRFPRRPLQKRHPTGWRFLRTPRLVQPSSRQPIPTPIQHFLKPASLFLPQAAVRIVALYNGLPRTAPNLMKICYCK